MNLRWTHRARSDLVAIRQYIGRDNPAAASRWIAKLRDKARSAASAPHAGRVVPELDKEDVREVFLRAYRIVYRVREDSIEVLTVFEGHHLLPEDSVD